MLQKRLDYGFNGYQVPFIPTAARSTRRRGSIRNKVEDGQLCAFDLLATVAGNLLLEGEIPQNTTVEKDQAVTIEDVVMEEQNDEVYPLKVEQCDQGSTEIPSLDLELGLQAQACRCNLEKVSVPQRDTSLIPASVVTSSDCLGKDNALVTMDLDDDDNGKLCNHSAKLEQCSAGPESCLPNVLECVEQPDSQGGLLSEVMNVRCSSEYVKFSNRKPPQLIGSDSSCKQLFGTNHYGSGSLSPSRESDVKVVPRDDDENSSVGTHPSRMTQTRRPARIGGRKIRKLLASKYRRVGPKVKDADLSDTELRYIYCNRKTGYRRQRSQRMYPFKKRRNFFYSSLSNSDENVSCKGIYSRGKAIGTTTASFSAEKHGVNGSSSSVTGHSTSFPSRESHVKVRIKSFRVPELFIEVPETATIGSLKRTVMEALTALLRGGLHVGVLLQGKKVRDDSRTLLQSGICQNDKVESLGFTLEPDTLHASAPFCSEDNSLVLSADVPEPVSRCPDAVTIQETSHPLSDHPVNSVGNLIESDHDSAPSPADISADKGAVDSRALVALPEESPQALAVIPAHQKSKRSELGQRRIRRPFSVAEVEALVQAVEKLGTGRWRDVKLRAFENVKHRTYVDLKDKWKTLVHTARISPQQRRGEPVPQELLDRVLAAHSYWSQEQAKQQLKQQSEACLLL